MAPTVLVLLAALPAVLGLSLDCTPSSTQPMEVLLKGPSHPIEITSPGYPLPYNFSAPVDCIWDIKALHGAQVRMTVIEAEMDAGCFENTLTVLDDSPQGADPLTSPLKFPGLSAHCGQSSLPQFNHPITSKGLVNMKFHSSGNAGNGQVRFLIKLEAVRAQENCPENFEEDYCPNGPCCEGPDCCKLHVGPYHKDIVSPNYPEWAGNGRTCSYSLWSEPGSQISINFLDMDLPSDQSAQACHSSSVQLVESKESASAAIGSSGLKFCGQLLPNYPGPSVFVSASNTLTVNFNTGMAGGQKGRGFKALASAINPVCNPMSYVQQYGDSECSTSCGEGFGRVDPWTTTTHTTTTTDTTTTTTGTVVTNENGNIIVTDENGSPDTTIPLSTTQTTTTTSTTTTTTSAVCTSDPSKVLSVTVITEETSEPVSGATVTISSAEGSIHQQFASYRTNIDGKVEEHSADNGVFTLSVSATGFISQTEDVSVECENIGCQDCVTEFTLSLVSVVLDNDSTNCTLNDNCTIPVDPVDPNNNGTTIPEVCDGAHGTITVYDLLTGLPLPGVIINVSLLNSTTTSNPQGHKIMTNRSTGLHGKLIIPLTMNGEYVIDIAKEGFVGYQSSETVSCHVDDCDNCNLDVTLIMEEDGSSDCGDVEMRIHIRNEYDSPVQGAEVNVLIAGQNIPMHFDPLITDRYGEATLHIMASAEYKIEAKAEGMFDQYKNSNFSCDPDRCELCTPVVVFTMQEEDNEEQTTMTVDPETNSTVIIPIDNKLCNDRESVSLVTEVFDLLTLEEIPGARIDITFVPERHADGDHFLASYASAGAHGQLNLDIRENGIYTAKVTADGYETQNKEVEVHCDPDNCDECTPKIYVALKQKFCEQTFMGISVIDIATGNSITGASVQVTMTVGDTHQIVSSHLVCPADRSVRLECGYYGITEEECDQDCCWDDSVDGELFCFHKTSLDKMVTNSEGIVTLPVSGRGEFAVEIEKEGYSSYSGDTIVSCPGSCEDCRPSLTVRMTPETPCNGTVDMSISVVDDLENPIEGAEISLILTSSVAGASSADVGGYLTTDVDGNVSPLLFESGTYMVTATAPGYLSKSVEKQIEIAENVCEDLHIPLFIFLDTNTEPPTDQTCENIILTITVKDYMTEVPLPGSVVDVLFEELEIASGVLTDENGQIKVPVNGNGEYKVITAHSGFIAAEEFKTINCTTENDCQCDTSLILSLDQPRCNSANMESPVLLPVMVKDNLTNVLISGARISLVLTKSLSGPSAIAVGQPLYSNAEGVAQFPIEMNGDYSVSISADGYIPAEIPVTVECNTAHCESCSPQAPIALNQDFCRDKELKLIVKCARTNNPVTGATVSATLEHYSGPMEIARTTTGESGEVIIPIIANGVYEAKVSMEGYIPFSTSYEVDVSPGECDILSPTILMPITKTPEGGCVSLSLTWEEEPQDLDLYSYRVHENNTNDQCLTYYCDGKDPCNGVTFDVDNKNGGLSGTETITYCEGSESYSNMIYVDDLSGDGRSLLASSARLIITSPMKTQEIVLNTTKGPDNENKRYWLAGCLTTNGVGQYEFLQLNHFTDIQPSVEDPLVCYSRVAFTNAHHNYGPELNGVVNIEVTDASTDEPIEQVLISLTNSRESHSRISDDQGVASLPISHTGAYSLLTELTGYVPEHHTINVTCTENLVLPCITQAKVSLLPTPANNSLEISLNWGPSSSGSIAARALTTISDAQDLDLHLLQVDKADTRLFCETYFSNPSGCANTVLNQNVQEAGSSREIITVDDITSHTGTETYMLFADDNSVSGPSLHESGARIVITDGVYTRIQDIPEMTEDTVAGSRYWLAGCIEILGNSLNYIPVDKFSRESPLLNEKYFCHNLFLSGGEVKPAEPFCPEIDMHITARDSLTNEKIVNAVASIVLEDEQNEYAIVSGEAPDAETGLIRARITENGNYIIRIEAEGYIPSREEYLISCEMAECDRCKPKMLVPLSPTLNSGELRMVLSWGAKPKDLDIYVMRRNVRDWDTSCITYHGRRSGCEEATLDLDNTKGGNEGVETITIHDTPSHAGNVYMIFVQHFGNNRKTEQFGRSQAEIRILDGRKISHISLDPSSYSQEKHWVAGCLKVTRNTYEFSPVNMFLNGRPDRQVPDLCLDTFGLSTTTTTTPRPRSTTTKRPWWRKIFG